MGARDLRPPVGQRLPDLAHSVVAQDAQALDGIVQRVGEILPQTLQVLAGLLHTGEPDVQSQDLVGPLEDAVDARVAQDPLVGLLAHEAHAGGDLQRLVGGGPE